MEGRDKKGRRSGGGRPEGEKKGSGDETVRKELGRNSKRRMKTEKQNEEKDRDEGWSKGMKERKVDEGE